MPAPSRRRDAGSAGVVQLPVVDVVAGDVAHSSLVERADALVLPVALAAEGDTGVQPRDGAADAAVRYGIDLGDLAERLKLTGKAGESASVELPRAGGTSPPAPWSGLAPRLVLVGVGAGSPGDLRKAGAAVARATRGLDTVVTTVAGRGGDAVVRAFAEGYLLGAYRHPTAAATQPSPPAERLVLLGDHSRAALVSAQVAAHVTWTARILSVTPSGTKNPEWLAARAAELAAQAGCSCDVLDEDDLAAAGFGGLVAVGSGSASPPRPVTVTWTPEDSGFPPAHVVLVGKGITFDTGGLSIKPREPMAQMKTDMTGAAVALSVVLGAARAGVRHRVTAVLALAENAVGAASYRPGDVVRVRGGTTVEVSNTDAEGRMVLADALAHADLTLAPDVLVDVATLTGAATMALGRTHGALFSPDDRLAGAMAVAGEETGERVWRMPLVEEYRSAIDSHIADVHHVAGTGFIGGGAIVAALFLQRFAGGRRWVHLDIAGPARSPSASEGVPEGATGFGARMLLRWLEGSV